MDDEAELLRLRDRDELADEDRDDDPFAGDVRTPVHVVGRIIARSPVGAAWCTFVDGCASPGRAERGQALVRAGALLDLKVRPGCIIAEVDVGVRVRPMVTVPLLAAPRRASLAAEVAAGSAVLQGLLARGEALPVPGDLSGSCGCSDRVLLCEHVLAALYGFGARLDAEPELLLALQGVEVVVSSASTSLVIAPLAPAKIALTGSLAALFGLSLRDEPSLVSEDAADEREEIAVDDEGDVASRDAASGHGPVSDPSLVQAAEEGEPDAVSAPPPAAEAAEPQVEVRRDYLKFIGIRSRTIDIWIREGVLLPTDRFHVYLRTHEANRRIAGKLAR